MFTYSIIFTYTYSVMSIIVSHSQCHIVTFTLFTFITHTYSINIMFTYSIHFHFHFHIVTFTVSHSQCHIHNVILSHS